MAMSLSNGKRKSVMKTRNGYKLCYKTEKGSKGGRKREREWLKKIKF